MTADTSAALPADDEPTAELLAQLKAIRQYLIKVSLVHESAELSDEQKQIIRDHLLWLNEQSE